MVQRPERPRRRPGPGPAAAAAPRYGDPRALENLGRKRLTTLLIRASRGAWREAKADLLLAAAEKSIELWAAGGLDFAELADDIITAEVRLVRHLEAEIAALEDRIGALYEEAGPAGIAVSAPSVGVTLAAGSPAASATAAVLQRRGGPLVHGLVPKVDQSGLDEHHLGPTKAGDPGRTAGALPGLSVAAEGRARPPPPAMPRAPGRSPCS